MKKELFTKQIAMAVIEWNETSATFPAIQAQLEDRTNSIVAQDVITDQDMNGLDRNFQSIEDQFGRYQKIVSTLNRRSAKCKDYERPDNLTELTSINEGIKEAREIIGVMRQSAIRRIFIQRAGKGCFLPPDNVTSEPDTIVFPGAPDEEEDD